MAIAWTKQAKYWKNFLLTFLYDTATQRQVINFLYHHDLDKILLTSICHHDLDKIVLTSRETWFHNGMKESDFFSTKTKSTSNLGPVAAEKTSLLILLEAAGARIQNAVSCIPVMELLQTLGLGPEHINEKKNVLFKVRFPFFVDFIPKSFLFTHIEIVILTTMKYFLHRTLLLLLSHKTAFSLQQIS